MHEAASEPISYELGDEDGLLIAPPPPASDVCSTCRGVNYGAEEQCENCLQNASSLDGRVEALTAISLYEKPGRLRDWLTFYKSGDETLADPSAVEAVTNIFLRFFQSNRAWLNQLHVDYAVVVPSTTRPAPHPLAVALQVPNSNLLHFEAPLRRTLEPLGHRLPNRHAFEVVSDVEGSRILLLDDVYTSGARAQSAAYALRSRGAEIAALCVLGRRYNPSYSRRAKEIFEAQRAATYNLNLRVRS